MSHDPPDVLSTMREMLAQIERSNALATEQLEHAKSSVKRQNARLDYSRRHALALERIAAALEVLVKR